MHRFFDHDDNYHEAQEAIADGLQDAYVESMRDEYEPFNWQARLDQECEGEFDDLAASIGGR